MTIALALTAALLFSLGNQTSRRALDYADSMTVTLYQIGVATALYWLATPFYLKSEYWASSVIFLLAAAGLVRPLVSANLGTAGTRILGPTVASTMSAVGPVISVTLGVLLLSEPLSWPVIAGTMGIVSATVVLTWRGATSRTWPVLALLFPLGAATIRAATHVAAKIGLDTVPSPFFIALVAYSVSFSVAICYHRFYHRKTSVGPPCTDGLRWMTVSGLLYAVAVLCMNTALLNGNLVVVSPVVACTPFFTLLLGLIVFKERHIDQRTIMAVAIVVPSVILITLAG